MVAFLQNSARALHDDVASIGEPVASSVVVPVNVTDLNQCSRTISVNYDSERLSL